MLFHAFTIIAMKGVFDGPQMRRSACAHVRACFECLVGRCRGPAEHRLTGRPTLPAGWLADSGWLVWLASFALCAVALACKLLDLQDWM